MEENRSVLRFKKYIVKNVEYNTNETYEKKDKEIELNFSFYNKTEFQKKEMKIELGVNIFKDAIVNNYPFEMKAVICGYFVIESDNEDISRFEKNAIAILFPYLRAIVSTYTSNSNIAPVILPIMNINDYLSKKQMMN